MEISAKLGARLVQQSWCEKVDSTGSPGRSWKNLRNKTGARDQILKHKKNGGKKKKNVLAPPCTFFPSPSLPLPPAEHQDKPAALWLGSPFRQREDGGGCRYGRAQVEKNSIVGNSYTSGQICKLLLRFGRIPELLASCNLGTALEKGLSLFQHLHFVLEIEAEIDAYLVSGSLSVKARISPSDQAWKQYDKSDIERKFFQRGSEYLQRLVRKVLLEVYGQEWHCDTVG